MTESDQRVAAGGKHVLIVEDDDVIRKLLCIAFKKNGHTVLEYPDSSFAMTDISRNKPRIDAAVVDLMNMGYGGNMGDFLRKMPEYRATMVIFYTALTQQQFNTKILNAPNTYYVQKTPGSFKWSWTGWKGRFEEDRLKGKPTNAHTPTQGFRRNQGVPVRS